MSEPVAVLRVWLDAPNLMISYSRHGIEIAVLALRTAAAKAAVVKIDELMAGWIAANAADPDRAEAINEILDMAREALSGGPGQLLPLDGPVDTALDVLFGKAN